MNALCETEGMKVFRREEMLNEKRINKIKMRYLEHLKVIGEISEDTYEEIKKRYMTKLRQSERWIVEVKRKKINS